MPNPNMTAFEIAAIAELKKIAAALEAIKDVQLNGGNAVNVTGQVKVIK